MALNCNSGALEKFEIILLLLKFIYSEKATKFCKISTLLLSVLTVDKSKVEISQNFVAFSELYLGCLQFRSMYKFDFSKRFPQSIHQNKNLIRLLSVFQ